MAKYAVVATRTASPNTTVCVVGSTATVRRGKIYDLTVGCDAAPADNAFRWLLQRFTAAGTTSAVTPQPLDPADAAALSAAGQNATVEPTYTANANLLTIPLNQRATFRWVAAPYGELVYPAVSASGIGLLTPTATALAVESTIHFEEQ